jgi:hypothetical protein
MFGIANFPPQAFQIRIGRGELGAFQFIEGGLMLQRIPAPAAIAFMEVGLFEINRSPTGFKIESSANVAVQSDQIMVVKRAAILSFRDTD